MYSATKLLSANDVALLNKDLKALNLAKKTAAIGLPFLTVLCAVSWYFSFYDVIIFLSTVLTILFTIGLFVSIKQGKNIRKDLEGNYKIVEHFILEKRLLIDSKSKRRSIVLSEDYEEYLKKVATYKKEIIDKPERPTFMQRESLYDETLRYTFKFIVKAMDKEPQEFIIPINYFIQFKDGDKITIEYGENSKKVLLVS
jgi:hypothetical protein